MNYGGCQMLDLAMGRGYFEDPDVFLCPVLDTPYPRKAHSHYGTDVLSPSGARAGNCRQPQPDGPFVRTVGIEEISYFFDEHRIHANSPSGRVILADGIEMCTEFGVEPANHEDGSTLLFKDGAVRWQSKMESHLRWTKDNNLTAGVKYFARGALADSDDANLPDADTQATLADLGYPIDGLDMTNMYATDASGPWVRYGYIPNPRLDEDGDVSEMDDVYECEAETPNMFFSYSMFNRCEGAGVALTEDDQPLGGKRSRKDAAVAGGCLLEDWFTAADARVPEHGDGWRGAHGAFYDSVGAGTQGVTWGVPEAFE